MDVMQGLFGHTISLKMAVIGVSLSNTLIWLIYIFSLFASYIRYKKQPTEA